MGPARRVFWSGPAVGPDSFHALGTRYEELVQAILQRSLRMRITRIGGRGDEGIDLVGEWKLPDQTLNAAVQCKRISNRASPSLVREFEGATMSKVHVGVIACTQDPTDSCRERLRQSPRPLLFLQIPEPTGSIQGVYASHSLYRALPQLTCVPVRASQLTYEFYYGRVRLKLEGP